MELTNKREVHVKCTLQSDNLVGSHQSTSTYFIVQARFTIESRQIEIMFNIIISRTGKPVPAGKKVLDLKKMQKVENKFCKVVEILSHKMKM